MALIKCKECAKEISDTAKQCPHCGFKKKKQSWFWPLILIFLFLAYCSQDEMIKKSEKETDKVEKPINNKSNVSKSKPNKTVEPKQINDVGRLQLKEQYSNPGYVESYFPQKESFWIFIINPPKGQFADNYAADVCNQAKNKYKTRGFVVTIWGLLDKKKYGKFPCF